MFQLTAVLWPARVYGASHPARVRVLEPALPVLGVVGPVGASRVPLAEALTNVHVGGGGHVGQVVAGVVDAGLVAG